MDPAGPLRAVHVLTPNGRFTVSAYAAPRSGDLWPEVSRELADQLHGDGARARREYGEWGAGPGGGRPPGPRRTPATSGAARWWSAAPSRCRYARHCR